MVDEKSVRNCVGCEYHERCIKVIFGILGCGVENGIKSGNKKNEWCENWKGWKEDEKKGVK